MAVQDEASFKRYAANGIATVYAIPFLLLNAADLQVVLDDVEVTTGFSVTGVGTNTGSITFSVAPSGDLLLQRVVPFERLTDYQDNGDLLADTVNRDFDRLWLAMQELRRDDSTALRTSSLEPEGIPNLPLAAARASRVLAFGPTGDPVVSSLTIDELEQQPALALSSAEAAAASALSASTSASTATAAAVAAVDARDKAEAWADEDEDVPVEPGQFSSKHWALKAGGVVGGLDGRVSALEAIGKPFTKEFISAEQSITSGGQLVIAHGLGAIPKLLSISLVCKTAEGGYAVNDVVDWHHSVYVSGASANRGCELLRDSSNVTVVFGSSTSAFELLNKSTGAITGITNANWRVVVRAWA